ncbi:hypothetical protein LG047_12495 [Methylocystis sp. WRRC1]|uniref:hypothetical protein n=1 Tax=unclassified Methylocystis TaxID=2625913 RepID=UPI0001F86A9E|nr:MULTISPECIES: hypothetical protein [unclassified Methylocystis]MCC3246129.1 hypothetical protein [Methylocystis sp. WRRC1]
MRFFRLLAFALAFALAALPALAGSLQLTSQIGAQPPTTITVNVPDADMGRIVAAYAAAYFPNGVEASPAVDCHEMLASDPPQPCTPTPAVMRPPTGEELMRAISQGLINGMMTYVVSYEQAQAAEAARAAVAPITVTPAQ